MRGRHTHSTHTHTLIRNNKKIVVVRRKLLKCKRLVCCVCDLWSVSFAYEMSNEFVSPLRYAVNLFFGMCRLARAETTNGRSVRVA